jgi:hypothetical protein
VNIKLNKRELAHVTAALRFLGRCAETSGFAYGHPVVSTRIEGHLPMTLDELETLIGKLDGTWKSRGLRTWDPFHNL